jgi:hypothetical protein
MARYTSRREANALDGLHGVAAQEVMKQAEVCARRAADGRLQSLRDLYESADYAWDFRAVTAAAERGQLECLRYLLQQNAPVDATACMRAAGAGELECLTLLHEHGAPWDTWTCAYAAARGNLACLRYAHEHGAPWDTTTRAWATKNGQVETLIYSQAFGAPCQ